MEYISLKNVCEILNGYAFKSSEYVDKGIRVIRITNVQKGTIVDEDPKFYPLSTEKIISKYILRENDILISLTGNVGRVGILKKNMLPAALNQRVACLRIKNDNFSRGFIFHLLNSDYFEQQAMNSAKGIAQKNMSTEWLAEYKIPLYDFEEQIIIENRLSYIDHLIILCKQQLADLDLLVKSQFIEMFGDPVTNPKGFIKAPMGNYMTVLTDFSSNGSYKTLDTGVTMYDEPNYAWMVRTTDLELGDMSSIKYIDKNAYELLSKSKIYGGEIIMNKIGSAGKIYLMPQINMPASLGRNAFMFRFDDRINAKYLYQHLITEYGQREIQQYVRGAVTKTITKNDARAILVIVPPIELQNIFVAFVQQVDKSKFTVQQSLNELELLKKKLMQDYFG